MYEVEDKKQYPGQPEESGKSRVGHVDDRHPLCPGCDYDLVGTVEAKGRMCPECGYEFELSELWHEARPDEWTVGRGIRRAAISLVLRSLVAVPLWGLAVWVTTQLGLGASVSMGLALAVVLGVAGAVVGAILARGLIDRAGFASFLLTMVASAFAFGVVTAGTSLAHLLETMTTAHRSMSIVFGWIASTLWVVRVTLFDD